LVTNDTATHFSAQLSDLRTAKKLAITHFPHTLAPKTDRTEIDRSIAGCSQVFDLISLATASMATVTIPFEDLANGARWNLFQAIRVTAAHERPEHLLHRLASIVGQGSRSDRRTDLPDKARDLTTGVTTIR